MTAGGVAPVRAKLAVLTKGTGIRYLPVDHGAGLFSAALCIGSRERNVAGRGPVDRDGIAC